MKMSEINKVFTDKVAEYMAKGYVINPVSMCGSQGEIGKVDLVKGEELIRVWMNDVSGMWDHPSGFTRSRRVVCVGRWNYPASRVRDSWDTVWYRDIEVLEEISFYEVKRDKWYVDSLEEALRIQKLAESRYKNSRPRYEEILNDPQRIEIARRFLKRAHGYKRVSSEKITLRQAPYGATYVITYNGHDYYLSASHRRY